MTSALGVLDARRKRSMLLSQSTECLYVQVERRRQRARRTAATWTEAPKLHTKRAAAEFPWKRIPHSMAKSAHGVSNQRLAERPQVSRLQRLPLRNAPPVRPATAASPDAADQHETAFRPRAGHPEDLLCACVLTEAENGAWVTRRMLQLRIKGKQWKLTAAELWAEVLRWFDVAAKDIREAERIAAGESTQVHRVRACTFVITEECFAADAQRTVWDLRAYWNADERTRASMVIQPVVAAPVNSSFDVAALRKLCAESKMGDEMMAECIQGAGIWREFTGEWSMVLEPNAKGFYTYLEEAQKTTKEEVEAGYLQGFFPGPPYMPCKLHSRNVALQFRNGKMKYRGTGNLSLHGLFMRHGTNSGWDFLNKFNFPDLEWATSEQFAADADVARTAFGDKGAFEIRKNDWYASRSYE